MEIKDILPMLITSTIGVFVGIFWKKIFHFPKWLVIYIHNKHMKMYNRTIFSEKFLLWQNIILEKYYGREYFTYVFNEYYPVNIFNGVNYTYPFDYLLEKNELELNKNIDNYKKVKYYKKYKRLLQPKHLSIDYHRIKRPEMQGYMLNELKFDENLNVTHLNAWVGRYVENVYTSHILEYENYILYCKYGKKNIELKNIFNKVKSKMDIRNMIHKDKNIYDVLKSGCNRASLLGVQLIVVIKDHEDHQYKILTIKRSDNVAARPGFFQFIPSGGFEIYGDEGKCKKYELIENFSVAHAVFREYIEEIYGNEDFESGKDGGIINDVRNNEKIDKIIKMIEIEKTAHFEFLGSIVGLVDLRNELSFVLIIKDENYSKEKFKPNFEGDKKRIDRHSILEIEKRIDTKKLNPSSAALYKLLTNNHLYKEILLESKSKIYTNKAATTSHNKR